MALFEVKKLFKTYYTDEVETPVLFDMNFTIEEGEFVAIMGPSGSGKSTLLHILGFLDEQNKGTFLFSGRQMEDCYEEEVAQIRNEEMGFVFQAFNLLPRTSVYDNVMLPLMYSKRPEKEWHERAMKAIKAVDLEHRVDHLSSQLSGGEKQRVAIARALVNEPKVIFADEPTGNLDSQSGQKVMEILEKLNKKGKHTVILITHETEVAEFAKRIIHIRDGRISSDRHVKNRRNSKMGIKK